MCANIKSETINQLYNLIEITTLEVLINNLECYIKQVKLRQKPKFKPQLEDIVEQNTGETRINFLS
jgi:hypothetical protein